MISFGVIAWLLAAAVTILFNYRLRVSKKSANDTRESKASANGPTSDANSDDWKDLDFTVTKPKCTSFDWTAEPEMPYRPWHDGPYHVTMGIQKTSLDDWVEIDKNYLQRYQYKKTLFSEHRKDTVCVLEGTRTASLEALGYLVDFLPRRYPSMFAKTAHGIQNLVTGDVWDIRENSDLWKTHEPLEVMGLLTSEDWFIMQTDPDGETTRLRAGANCFPAGWKLQERVGMSLWQIHAGKVPQYEEKLAKSMDRFFVRMRVDKPVMRFNYAIDNSSELFHIHSHHNLTLETLETPLTLDQLHLRVERQFLQRLPKSRSMIFSIRTYVTPITEVTKDLKVARALRTSVGSYSPELSKYKNKPLWDALLANHLDEILPPSDQESENKLETGKE